MRGVTMKTVSGEREYDLAADQVCAKLVRHLLDSSWQISELVSGQHLEATICDAEDGLAQCLLVVTLYSTNHNNNCRLMLSLTGFGSWADTKKVGLAVEGLLSDYESNIE